MNSNENKQDNSHDHLPPGAHMVTLADVPEGLHGLGQEIEEGNVEYKLRLIDPSPKRFAELVTQMKWRLGEGGGEAIYEIGVADNGDLLGLTEDELNQSFDTLQRMAATINAEASKVSHRIGSKGACLQALVREYRTDEYIDVRVAVAGNVDSGKSTLIGVLVKGALDDGRGSMRQNVFNHRHEVESGRTSSISHQIVGFDASGSIVNYKTNVRSLSWGEIIQESSKVVTMFDLAGHERYLKTTVAGMTGQMPDYALLLVGANMGVQKMTKEHLGLALALKIPFILVVTKIDIAPPNVLEQTLNDLKRILKLRGVRRMAMSIRTKEDSVRAACAVAKGEAVVPLFLISSVTGVGVDLIRHFINLLGPRVKWSQSLTRSNEVAIDDTYFVTGVGTVVGGTVLGGVVQNNANMLLGPDGNGNFIPVQIKSIHCKRIPVKQVRSGQAAGFALRKIRRSAIRKGMVLVEKGPTPPLACYQFDAEIVVLFHSTTIRINYQPVIQCLSIRQAARIVKMSTDVLRTGDKATVTFRFMYRPEYMHTGVRLVIREGTTRGMGVVTKLYRGTPAELDAAGDDLSAFEVDAPLIDKKTNGNTSSNSTTSSSSSASASVPPAPQTAKVQS